MIDWNMFQLQGKDGIALYLQSLSTSIKQDHTSQKEGGGVENTDPR